MKTPDINGKTPEEIKKGIANAVHVKYLSWPDENTGERRTLHGVAIGYVLRDEIFAYIQQLESRLAQAELERNAAVADIRLYAGCKVCKFGDFHFTPECMDCSYDNNNWEWRGVCEENTKEENK